MGINKFNAEGYYDPTAYEAMTNIIKEEKAFFAFRPVVYICSPYENDRGLPERSYRLHTDKKRIPVRKEHRGYAYLHPRASVPGH